MVLFLFLKETAWTFFPQHCYKIGFTHFKLQLWLLNLFSFSSSSLQGKHQNVLQYYCYSHYHSSASTQPFAKKKKKETLLRKFADDAQIDRTINSIYVFENRVSCCTKLSSDFLSNLYQFQCQCFPQSQNL